MELAKAMFKLIWVIIRIIAIIYAEWNFFTKDSKENSTLWYGILAVMLLVA